MIILVDAMEQEPACIRLVVFHIQNGMVWLTRLVVGQMAIGNRLYDYFIGFYNELIDSETPHEVLINGFKDSSNVNYEITISTDADTGNDNQKVQIIVVEDKIMSYWTGASEYHNARNVARYWISTEDLEINSAGESQTFSGSFEIDEQVPEC